MFLQDLQKSNDMSVHPDTTSLLWMHACWEGLCTTARGETGSCHKDKDLVHSTVGLALKSLLFDLLLKSFFSVCFSLPSQMASWPLL